MKTNPLHQYISARANLEREREDLLARLRQIEEALGAALSVPALGANRGRGARRGNPMTLRDAVLRVTSRRPMTKEEILQAVQQLGYRFTGKGPINVLGVVLSGKNPRFRNEQGRFSPIGRGSQSSISNLH